jgi:hypothetical protein
MGAGPHTSDIIKLWATNTRKRQQAKINPSLYNWRMQFGMNITMTVQFFCVYTFSKIIFLHNDEVHKENQSTV